MGYGGHDDRGERAYGGGRAHPYAREGGGGGGGGAVSGNRVFVHNLSYKTSWQDLKDFARQARAPRGRAPRRAPAAGGMCLRNPK